VVGLAAKLRQNHRLHLVQVAGFAGSPAIADPDEKVAAPTAMAVATTAGANASRCQPSSAIRLAARWH
jgi:hypothetical protein